MKKSNEKDVLINRTEMIKIAREFKIFISRSTIHRWANERDFPVPIGKAGRNILYYKGDFSNYLEKRIRKIREDC